MMLIELASIPKALLQKQRSSCRLEEKFPCSLFPDVPRKCFPCPSTLYPRLHSRNGNIFLLAPNVLRALLAFSFQKSTLDDKIFV